MTRVLHTARISYVDSVMFIDRIREVVSFELGEEIEKAPRSWQDEKHLSLFLLPSSNLTISLILFFVLFLFCFLFFVFFVMNWRLWKRHISWTFVKLKTAWPLVTLNSCGQTLVKGIPSLPWWRFQTISAHQQHPQQIHPHKNMFAVSSS